MKYFKELICWIFGHRSICLYSELHKNHREEGVSMTTSWKCERCGYTFTEGWDI